VIRGSRRRSLENPLSRNPSPASASKHGLQARPIYHRQRDSIKTHLTIVFAPRAVSRWIEDRTGWSIKKFVKRPPLQHLQRPRAPP
jgi:hypothetical protein